jgi:hypothetical protein
MRSIESEPVWSSVGDLPGTRVTRMQIAARDYELRDASGRLLATTPRRRRQRKRIGSVLEADGVMYETDFRKTEDENRGPHFSLEKLQPHPTATREVLARQSGMRTVFSAPGSFSMVTPSPKAPFGSVNEWHLPNGRTAQAFCLGESKPLRVLSLRDATGPMVTIRYLAPRVAGFDLWRGINPRRNFAMGESVLSERLPLAPELLPVLMFAFEIAQAVNWEEAGGG